MPAADVLRELGPVDPVPEIEELGGERGVLQELPELDSELLPRLIEAVANDIGSVEDPEALGSALVARLPEIAAPLSFANSADSLLRVTLVAGRAELAASLMDALLEVTRDHDGPERGLRAGYAVRAAVDLALLDAGVSAHAVLAAIERVEDVPPEMASGMARAIGRLWEHYDESFLQQILEERVLSHDTAVADATVELALKALRDAFYAGQPDETVGALERSVELFGRVRAYDEDRADARAYEAAARAVLAFGSGSDDMTAALDDLTAARAELDRYDVSAGGDFRGATPLRSIAGWHILAATLRNLRANLDKPDVLNLRPAVEALASAYEGMRLAVLDDERLGLQAFIQPVISSTVAKQPALADGVSQLADEPGASSAAKELAGEVVRPKARTRRVRRVRFGKHRP
jgi:hypothetical protein